LPSASVAGSSLPRMLHADMHDIIKCQLYASVSL